MFNVDYLDMVWSTCVTMGDLKEYRGLYPSNATLQSTFLTKMVSEYALLL
jgi:hypothetical protein